MSKKKQRSFSGGKTGKKAGYTGNRKSGRRDKRELAEKQDRKPAGFRKRSRTGMFKKHKAIVLDLIRSKNYQPMRAKEIAFLLDLRGPSQKELYEILDVLEAEKKVRVNARGAYIKITQKSDTPDVPEQTGKWLFDEVTKTVLAYGISPEFPKRVLDQADRCPDRLLAGDFQGRLDLRDWTMVTIDGEDAKDLDDAVSLTRESGLFCLGVHIADVSNYVQANSALDREAQKRGTSVYLADRVIPMLPRRLSNGICSLNAGEDRLALSCIMKISKEGKIVSSKIRETVIRVTKRMSYTEVNRLLEGEDETLLQQDQELVPMLRMMHSLSRILRENRRKRGGIDFDFPETEILMGEDGEPDEICPHETNEATRMIEDFMLAANETVAETYRKKNLPFVYRVHEEPDEDRIEEVIGTLHRIGVPIVKKERTITPKEVQGAMDAVAGKPEEPQVSRMLLRAMKQAKYSPEPIGHFGLAAKDYCHFTSPIRRYPDLQIHRIIKDDLRGRLNEKKKKEYARILEDVAWRSSALERRAVEAERETNKLEMAAYVRKHLGEEADGVISGVTGWGIYVELPSTVEGLVHITSLQDDFYVYDEEHMCLSGKRNGKTFSLGQPVRIRLENADLERRTVDFRLVEEMGKN